MVPSTEIRDLNGRRWIVRRTFTPWWRFFRPIDLVRKDRPISRSPEPVKPPPPPDKPMRWWQEILMGIVGPPVIVGLAFLFVLGAPVERLAAGVAGGVLWVLRSLGLARHRIDVMGLEGSDVRSLSVVLVKGSHQDAEAMVTRLKARLVESDTLDLGVPLHAHKSYWD